jgi:hypothetical protein
MADESIVEVAAAVVAAHARTDASIARARMQ